MRTKLMLVGAFLLSSCGPSLEDRLGELVRAKDTWAATAGDSHYSYQLQLGQNLPYTVPAANPGTLRDDWLENPPCSDLGVCRVNPTMRELFQLVLELTDTQLQSGGELSVVYDEDLGFPKRIFWDDYSGSHSQVRIAVSDVVLIEADLAEACDYVRTITLMPMKSDGDDPAYLALIERGADALQDLVRCISNQSVMPDPRQAPVYAGTTVGDVAFWTFARIADVSIEEFLPREYKEKWEANGVYAYFEYVANLENRLALQARVSTWLDTNEPQ